MKRQVLSTIAAGATALLIVGCSGGAPEGTLAITENGTYDVSEYASVQVNVEAEEDAEDEPTEAVEEEPVEEEVEDLTLTNVQFADFSMDLPAAWVEDYTEDELTQNDHFNFNSEDGSSYLTIDRNDTIPFDEWSNYIDGESTAVNGYDAIVHRDHTGDSRSITATIEMSEGYLMIDISHPVEQDDIYEPLIEDILASVEVD